MHVCGNFWHDLGTFVLGAAPFLPLLVWRAHAWWIGAASPNCAQGPLTSRTQHGGATGRQGGAETRRSIG
jgi:hypothetical protein